MLAIHQPTKTDALSLLNAANLPTSDLTEAHMDYFWSVSDQRGPIGIVGLEPLAPYGLLRSLVVTPFNRSQGIGTKLVHHAEKAASRMNIRELYLFTSTAQEFFENFGYRRVPRRFAPAQIRSTTEFTKLPAHTLLMKKQLK